MSMKLIYLAGPYRAFGTRTVDDNIDTARHEAKYVAMIGVHYPVTPHLNTGHFDGKNTDEYFLRGTLELMRRCDAVLMLPGWEYSSGAVAEREEAIRLGLTIYESLTEYSARFWASKAKDTP